MIQCSLVKKILRLFGVFTLQYEGCQVKTPDRRSISSYAKINDTFKFYKYQIITRKQH